MGKDINVIADAFNVPAACNEGKTITADDYRKAIRSLHKRNLKLIRMCIEADSRIPDWHHHDTITKLIADKDNHYEED